MKIHAVIFSTAFLTLSACSNKNTSENTTPQDVVIIPQTQLDTLNKAKAVEGTLMQADKQRHEQIDQ